jgi:hypothetical protein
MSSGIITIALVWGVISGYLVIRIIDCLAGFSFCLHALLMGRWNRLTGKPPVGQVKPVIILRLMLQVTILAGLFGALLHFGYNFTRGELWFDYGGWGAILYAAVACATALSRLPATRRRLVFFWKMSHEFDFAQRRQRTLLLKS